MAEFAMRRRRLPSSGVLKFDCPKCSETLEVMLAIDKDAPVEEMIETQLRHLPARKHPVEFIAYASNLHAEFWGHMVRCHQPDPHPYMSGGRYESSVSV